MTQGHCTGLVTCIHLGLPNNAPVVKLVDTLDLGSSALRRGGSSPSRRTKFKGFVPLVKQLSKWCPGDWPS